MANNFKKLEIKQPPAFVRPKRFSESKYWKSFKVDVSSSKYAPVSSIHISPAAPYDFAVTSGTRVQIYDGKRKVVTKEFTKFKDMTYSGCLRDDGKLMCAGGKEGLVTVFDCATKTPLRKFRKNQGPVHVTKFVPDSTLVLTGSDDCTVRQFDLPTQTQVSLFEGHADHVRAASVLQRDVIVSGGYDHMAKVWDARSGQCTLTLDHKFPIDAMVVLPGASMIATAGNTVVRLWDMLAGGKLAASFSVHHKNITCLCVDGERKRLLSGGIDQMVKIYSLKTHTVTAHMEYPSPLLCLGVNPNNNSVIAGMENGLLLIRSRTPSKQTDVDDDEISFLTPKEKKQAKKEALIKKDDDDDDDDGLEEDMFAPSYFSRQQQHEKKIFGGTRAWFVRGLKTKNETGIQMEKQATEGHMNAVDKHLRKFEYKTALDQALQLQDPLVIVSLFEELFVRDGVMRAVSGRNNEFLALLLRVLVKHISHPTYTPTLVKVSNVILDVYSGITGQSVEVDELIQQLRDKLTVEIRLQYRLLELTGAIDMLVQAQTADTTQLIHSNANVQSAHPEISSDVVLEPLADIDDDDNDVVMTSASAPATVPTPKATAPKTPVPKTPTPVTAPLPKTPAPKTPAPSSAPSSAAKTPVPKTPAPSSAPSSAPKTPVPKAPATPVPISAPKTPVPQTPTPVDKPATTPRSSAKSKVAPPTNGNTDVEMTQIENFKTPQKPKSVAPNTLTTPMPITPKTPSPSTPKPVPTPATKSAVIAAVHFVHSPAVDSAASSPPSSPEPARKKLKKPSQGSIQVFGTPIPKQHEFEAITPLTNGADGKKKKVEANLTPTPTPTPTFQTPTRTPMPTPKRLQTPAPHPAPSTPTLFTPSASTPSATTPGEKRKKRQLENGNGLGHGVEN